MTLPVAPEFLAIDLQLNRPLQQGLDAAKAVLVAWLCLWVVGCSALALNDSWHQAWHQAAGDPPASESGCAIDLFASGGVAPGLEFIAVAVNRPDAVQIDRAAAGSRRAQRLALDLWQTRGPPTRG